MRTRRRTLGLVVALGLTAPVTLTAQAQEDGAAPPAAQDSTAEEPARREQPAELVFEREVFQYPEFQRRNPFRVLLGDGSGPRFESMSVQGIIYSAEDRSGSMVLMRAGQAEAEQQAQSRRLRLGETWGNVRVLEVRRTEVVVEVTEFGLTEQKIMRLPTRAQGGS